MESAFEQAHAAFMTKHKEDRSGERRGRLLRGHGHGEKMFLSQVWWPLFRSLDSLHPEYEVYDWNRRSFYLDFAFITPFARFGIECDGFQTHVKDMDRDKFNYSLRRDTFLTATGWRMLHFSVDELRDNPELCKNLLKLALGLDSRAPHNDTLTPPSAITPRDAQLEKEILKLAWKLSRPLRPKDVRDEFKVGYTAAHKHLQALTTRGLLRPISTGVTMRYYELCDVNLEDLI